ncbi:uncharacterized protein V1516DRAFT_454635 [Lipomyces oligophaga]|uniref:uncharacterized protein n=1 Tax=Lipomyces oligophaga TaxID=45792 RepID=UPI0034CD3ED4
MTRSEFFRIDLHPDDCTPLPGQLSLFSSDKTDISLVSHVSVTQDSEVHDDSLSQPLLLLPRSKKSGSAELAERDELTQNSNLAEFVEVTTKLDDSKTGEAVNQILPTALPEPIRLPLTAQMCEIILSDDSFVEDSQISATQSPPSDGPVQPPLTSCSASNCPVKASSSPIPLTADSLLQVSPIGVTCGSDPVILPHAVSPSTIPATTMPATSTPATASVLSASVFIDRGLPNSDSCPKFFPPPFHIVQASPSPVSSAPASPLPNYFLPVSSPPVSLHADLPLHTLDSLPDQPKLPDGNPKALDTSTKPKLESQLPAAQAQLLKLLAATTSDTRSKQSLNRKRSYTTIGRSKLKRKF